MSLNPVESQLIAMVMIVVLILAMYQLYKWTKSRSPNTELWGTIFESLTHYVQPQAQLKEPKQEIVKQKGHSGDDEDKNEPN